MITVIIVRNVRVCASRPNSDLINKTRSSGVIKLHVPGRASSLLVKEK